MLSEDLLYRLVGKNIRAARLRVSPSMSQAKLAARLGLSRVSIVNIEAGRQRPPIHVLWQIATELDTEPALLLPRRAEYAAELPKKLSPAVTKQIAKYAKGDAETRRTLAAFISIAQKRLTESE